MPGSTDIRVIKPQRSANVSIWFCGERIVCPPGVSVAAALTSAGIRVFRTTQGGAGRGIFCGMGVCQDCVVSVDGTPGQRACMTIVHDGMMVETHLPFPPARGEVGVVKEVELSPDLLVIGGGPAGLSAAAAAAECGLDVVLFEERAKLGGQFY